jgi:hypothetical protein
MGQQRLARKAARHVLNGNLFLGKLKVQNGPLPDIR